MTRIQTLFVSLVAVAALAACSKSDSGNKKPAEPAAPKTEPAPPEPAPPPAAASSFADGLAAYETIHAALAADKTDGVAEAATKLADLAGKAGEGAAENVKPHYAGLANACGELAKAGDLAGARAAFGDVSREMVGLLEMSPDLAKGQHMFECPMAKGYKRWVQSSAELSNPYMGTEMATCGSEVAFGEHDMGDMGGMKHDMGGMDHGKMKGN